MGNRIQISRVELYDKIWSTPISRVAKEFGLSDVGLAKICRRHQIPRPSVGYWAQVQHGYSPRQFILPPITDKRLEIVEITIKESPLLTMDPTFKKRAETERAAAEEPEFEIVVPESLCNPHSFVQDAITAFHAAKEQDSGILVPNASRIVNIRVSPLCLQRALRIWNSLILALESLGYKTTVQEESPNETVVTILEETIPIHISEEIHCTVRDATAEEQAKWRRKGRYETKVSEYTPTGRLCLRLGVAEGFGLRKKWSDTARANVETKLVGFVHGLIDMAVHIRADRIEREQRRQRWEQERLEKEELRKQYKEEKARFEILVKEVDGWHLSQELRAYAEAIRANEVQLKGRVEPATPIAMRIEWIIQQADRLDPLKDTPPSLLDGPEPSWW